MKYRANEKRFPRSRISQRSSSLDPDVIQLGVPRPTSAYKIIEYLDVQPNQVLVLWHMVIGSIKMKSIPRNMDRAQDSRISTYNQTRSQFCGAWLLSTPYAGEAETYSKK